MKIDSFVNIDLSGKVAMVTGGTRGIGKAIAQRLLDAGADLIITGTKRAKDNKLDFEKIRGTVTYMQVDFSSIESTNNFLSKIANISKIDILVNNAGVNRINLNTDTSSEDYDLLNNINLKAPYLLCREVSKLMKEHHGGKIVNITSIWSTITRPGRSLYSLTKNGLVGLTKSLAIELAKNNILVNAVAPGFTSTELTLSTNTAGEIVKLSEAIPIKRMAQPIEIANLVLFLCSDLNTYLTGQNIIIDGGYSNV